jgi:uncharacterized membrane protein HdeD (DUF308 family)
MKSEKNKRLFNIGGTICLISAFVNYAAGAFLIIAKPEAASKSITLMVGTVFLCCGVIFKQQAKVYGQKEK